jgi:hypothetical protein
MMQLFVRSFIRWLMIDGLGPMGDDSESCKRGGRKKYREWVCVSE